jgi:hypothetical protein
MAPRDGTETDRKIPGISAIFDLPLLGMLRNTPLSKPLLPDAIE